MQIDDMERAVDAAKAEISRADRVVGIMARMIVGRLRKANVSSWVLRDLKTELMKFNRHTMRWRD